MRHAMRPDEAFGMIFSWDNVVADTRVMQRRAWQTVAKAEGLPWPAIERNFYDVRPERVITEVLQWTRDWKVAQRLAWEVAMAFGQQVQSVKEPQSGVRDWLQALKSCKMPCALVGNLDRVTLMHAAQRMGLQQYFQAYVTAEDGMETISQRFLSASIKLARPPNQCVVFESGPPGITAAHNCTMKVVAVQGAHKGYQLKAADLTCSNMTELTVYNIRRLFANRGNEFMDLRFNYNGTGINNTRRQRIANAVVDP
jgi:beta-phosphoglucomutase-like phosphatase (HAD superfamily)